ncbi:helix-turn-helix transcriptional regulator [Acidihalobacter aeolianus]|uniref:helix-turn-helix transcriptional regulator n=1 Tax=Acidihalobacter aeolianus TaxID=2792603 RepID=UPI0038B33697
MTKADVASYLGVTIRTVDNLVLRGELPGPQHIGRRVYWLKEEFDNHIRDCLRGIQHK